MTSFIIIALLITIVVLGLLLWPLRKNRHSVSYARQAQNIHYAKERIRELEEQLENASISATDYEALKLEIESTLADDIDLESKNTNKEPIHVVKSNAGLITSLCLFVPLFAAIIYYFAGTPESFKLAKEINEQPSQQDVGQLLLSIEERLKSNPSDVEGWIILSRSYLSLGRYHEAKQGFKKLLELEGESAELLTTLADASSLAAGGVMAGEPMFYINRALELDSQNPQALWIAGIGAAQVGDTDISIKHWTKLVPLLESSPQQQQELRDLIAKTKQQALLLNPEKNTLTEEKPLANQEPLADKEPLANKEELSVTDQQTSSGIRVNVFIDPTLASQVSATDTVFVFAKATQGPPAPLAVKRLTVAELPASIILNDEDAMLAQFKLSLFENVSISARIAKSGNPIAQSGDLESTRVDVKNNTKDKVNVVISSIVK